VKFHPQKPNEVFSGSMDSTVIHWDYARLKVINSYQFTSNANGAQIVNPPLVHSIDVCKDGSQFVAGLGDMTAAVFDLKTRKRTHLLEGHTGAVSQVCFPAFEPLHHVISGSTDTSIILWCLGNDASQSQKKKTTEESVEKKQDSCVQQKSKAAVTIPHKGKINWLTTASWDPSKGNVFVADENEEVTIYSITTLDEEKLSLKNKQLQ